MIHHAKPPAHFPWRPTLCRLALCGGLLLPGLARAQQSTWFGGSGAWDESSNWLGGLPNSETTATIASGTASVTDYSEFGSMIVGTGVGSAATVELGGNAFLSGSWGLDGSTILGQAAGSQGTVNMNAGLWTNTSLTIGLGGEGTMNITGGDVTSDAGVTLGSLQGSIGRAVISGGTLYNNAETLKVGASGTGSLTVSGGYIWTGYTNVGEAATGAGVLAVTSGTFESQDEIRLGVSGSGAMTIGGGHVITYQTHVGASSTGGAGKVVMNSGTWNTTANILVGTNSSRGEIEIHGGLVTGSSVFAGDSGGTATMTVTGGTWTNSMDFRLGFSSTASLSISGGAVSSQALILGNNLTGKGTVLVTGGTLATGGSTTIGDLGSNSWMDISTGGIVTTGGNATIGLRSSGGSFGGNFNTVTISDNGSMWLIQGDLTIGEFGANNSLTIQDSALVRVGQTLSLSDRSQTNNNNFLRLDGGYIALLGDQTAAVAALITGGELQIWDGDTWIVSTDLADFDYDFFATAQAAENFSGYSGLGGYTILTTVIPEPQSLLLATAGLGLLLSLRRKRPR